MKIIQSKMISEENIRKPRLRAKENEHATNALDDNKVIIENKEKKEDNCIVPKHMLLDYFYEKHNNVVKNKESRNSNKHEALKDNNDD